MLWQTLNKHTNKMVMEEIEIFMRYLDQKLKLVVNKDNYHVFSFSGTHDEVIYIEQHKVKRL